MGQKVLRYGVMFGGFAPILKKDFDIARRVMRVKSLDGVVFVPNRHKYGEFGVDPKDKITLIKLAAQDYVNETKEDAAYMVSNIGIFRNNTVDGAMALLAKGVEESNKNTGYYIEHIPIVDEDDMSEGDAWSKIPHIKYSKRGNSNLSIIDVSAIPNVDFSFYKLHEMIKNIKKIPVEYMTGSGHAYFYLNACLNLE